jgi:glutamyl-tRNA reductase
MEDINELVFDLLARVEKSRQKELEIAFRKMGTLDDHQKRVVSELTSKLVGKLFQPVVENIRQAAVNNETTVVEAAEKLLVANHN